MGLDFITKCAKSFTRSWDRGRREFSEPDLFRRDPVLRSRVYCVVPRSGFKPSLGQELLIRADGATLRIYTGTDEAGAFRDIPESLLSRVRSEGCGVAVGRVVRVRELSGVVEVSVA